MKVSAMNGHLHHAHHTGLIVGTIIGSCAVTALTALALVIAQPSLITHPLDIKSSVTVSQPNSTNEQSGIAVSGSQNVLPEASAQTGIATKAVPASVRR